MEGKDIAAHLYCLVMAGGSGTRFWPISTKEKPKQYLALGGDKPLLAQTLLRFGDLLHIERRFVVTIQQQQQQAWECTREYMLQENIILEPSPRNTAPCLLLSLMAMLEAGASSEDVAVVVPADHVILNEQGFQKTVLLAAQLSLQEDKIVTIGINPYFPHTGFGYIRKGAAYSHLGHEVAQFVEKPDLATARSYVASGEYLWNAGIFVGKIRVLLEEMQLHAPEIAQFATALGKVCRDENKLQELYQQIPANSIDYAVMEKSKRVLVVPAEFDWNDLGSWDALESVCEKVEGNVIASNNPHYYFAQSSGNVIFTHKEQFISLINVQDLIVINSEKALIVLPKQDSQRVKDIVGHLEGRKEGELFLK